MTIDTVYPQRKNTRLRNYDYTSNSAYHVIICTRQKRKVLSEIIPSTNVNELPTVILTPWGEAAEATVREFDVKYPGVHVTAHCIMPNHIHLMVEYSTTEDQNTKHIALSSFVSQFKGSISKKTGISLWQNSYYEHVIREDRDYLETLRYIQNNPAKWATDEYY